MNVVMREEKKFLINTEEFKRKRHFLNQVMIPDPHNGDEGYLIRSLYFDTVYDDDFFEKMNGVELRRKLRLRCYDPKLDFAMLEVKQKQGQYQMKRSLRLSRADAQSLIEGKYDVLLRYKKTQVCEYIDDLSAELTHKYEDEIKSLRKENAEMKEQLENSSDVSSVTEIIVEAKRFTDGLRNKALEEHNEQVRKNREYAQSVAEHIKKYDEMLSTLRGSIHCILADTDAELEKTQGELDLLKGQVKI